MTKKLLAAEGIAVAAGATSGDGDHLGPADRRRLGLPGGRVVDVGVLEAPDGTLLVSPALEIRVAADHDFFDYQAKYEQGITRFVVPADLDEATTVRLRGDAIRVFRTLGCAGLPRVDFFVAPGGGLTVNEVSTMPELTAMSKFPRMWQAAGLPYRKLLDVLIRTALRPSGRPARALASWPGHGA
ncbi:hypothetical protein ACSDR0_37880 [Streptosporangium sp. G11]|uniref:hypothetical protein n=1 Tax=Streptosporangium sp. G11 TaxID=3436926 RepID=UPI003EBE7C60